MSTKIFEFQLQQIILREKERDRERKIERETERDRERQRERVITTIELTYSDSD